MFHPFEYAGRVRIPPPAMQLRVRREVNTHDAINARQFEAWQSDVPQPQGDAIEDPAGLRPPIKDGPVAIRPVAYDMAPASTRTDKRDYRQAQPFVANGPSLAMNPYFDRYDPTRDPRNMIREMQGAVYEVKEADRGLEESKRMVARGYISRWMPEGSSQEELQASIQAYEIMRPKMDNINTNYRDERQAASKGAEEQAIDAMTRGR